MRSGLLSACTMFSFLRRSSAARKSWCEHARTKRILMPTSFPNRFTTSRRLMLQACAMNEYERRRFEDGYTSLPVDAQAPRRAGGRCRMARGASSCSMVMTSSVERKDDVGGALECWVAKSPLKRCWGRHIECLSSGQLDERGGTGRKEGTGQSASDRTYVSPLDESPTRRLYWYPDEDETQKNIEHLITNGACHAG
jgi:hypothetical protein